MNREDFLKKLEEHEKSIEKKSHEIQQGMADLNVLIGHRNECLYWISTFDRTTDSVSNVNPINKIPVTLDDFKRMTGANEVRLLKDFKKEN